MKLTAVIIAALFISCAAPKRVVLRIDRSACMRVDKISKDVELVVIDCKAPRDTILVIKDVAVQDEPDAVFSKSATADNSKAPIR